MSRLCQTPGSLATRTGGPGRAGLDAAANLGVGIASVSALVALGRIKPLGGMLCQHDPDDPVIPKAIANNHRAAMP